MAPLRRRRLLGFWDVALNAQRHAALRALVASGHVVKTVPPPFRDGREVDGYWLWACPHYETLAEPARTVCAICGEVLSERS